MLISSISSEGTAVTNWSIFIESTAASKERVSSQPSTHPALQLLSSFPFYIYLYAHTRANLLKKQLNL